MGEGQTHDLVRVEGWGCARAVVELAVRASSGLAVLVRELSVAGTSLDDFLDRASTAEEGLATATVPIATLQPADSPRLAGEDGAHIRLLAQVDDALPPILVHRSTMRVIDGMHRLEAAVLRGEDTIEVRFFDGDAADAFVLGVRANTAHGLPLTVADRRAAAQRIVSSHPQWSDRAIAQATGLSAKTVGRIRKCATGENPHLRTRIGRDGRARPVNSAEGRLRACALMEEKPTASMRQIAAEAGISLGTVRDVRHRLSRGEDPVPRRAKRARATSSAPPVAPVPTQRSGSTADVVRPKGEQPSVLLYRLKIDPSLRFNEAGRALIRLLGMHTLGRAEQEQLLETVPEHLRPTVADLARACAETWWDLAERLSPEQQSLQGLDYLRRRQDDQLRRNGA